MDAARLERWVRSMATRATRRSALRGTAALATGGALRLLSTSQATEARRRRRRVAASCGGAWDGSSSGGQAGASIAQTFTARVSGKLTQVQFNVGRDGASGDFIVRLGDVDIAGVPLADAPPLAETNVSDDTLPQFDLVRVTAKFTTSPAEVTKGTKYALIVTRATAFAVGTHNDGDRCLGDYYHMASGAGNFSESENVDLVFKASVR
jgi:hypothetical protein